MIRGVSTNWRRRCRGREIQVLTGTLAVVYLDLALTEASTITSRPVDRLADRLASHPQNVVERIAVTIRVEQRTNATATTTA